MDFSKLQEEYAQLHNQNNKVIEASAVAGKMTSEDKQANEARFARMDEIKALIDNHKQAAKYAALADMAGEQAEAFAPKVEKFDARKALERYILSGEKFTITSETGGSSGVAGSGVLVPESIGTPIATRRNVNQLRAALAYRGYSPLKAAQFVTLSLPIFDDGSSVGQAQSESATSQTILEVDPTSVELRPKLATSKGVWFSNTVLGAPGFDVLSYVIPTLEKRVDLYQESAWLTNVRATTTGFGDTVQTAATTSTITYANILDWEHKISYAKRIDSVAIVSDSFYKLIRGLVDSDGRPLLDVDPQSMITSFHGIPLFVSDNMSAVGAGNTVGVLFSADAVKLYDAGSPRLARYTLQDTRPDQTGLELFVNGDAGVVDIAAGSLFKMAAS